jgi:hypothetical protein
MIGKAMKRIAVITLIAEFAAWGCSGPTSPEPEPLGPAAIVSIDSVSNWPGSSVTLSLRVDYATGGCERLDTLGGFDLSVLYDPSILTFRGNVQPGAAISAWEYFTYRMYSQEQCNDCSQVRIRISGQRDFDNNAPVVPPQGFPEGELVSIRFLISSDWNYIDSTTELTFHSTYCGDNTFSTQSAPPKYYMANTRFGPDSEAAAFDTLECSEPIVLDPVLEFRGGRVSVKQPPTIPGDVDLDSRAYTGIDLSFMFDLFYGTGSWSDSSLIPQMIANTDCNRDGEALTVADVEYLVRVTVGETRLYEALPPPYEEHLDIGLVTDGANWLISGASTSPVSGLDIKIISPSGSVLAAEWLGRANVGISTQSRGDTLRIVVLPGFSRLDLPLLEGEWAPPIRIFSDGEERPVIVAAQASMAPGVLMTVTQ